MSDSEETPTTPEAPAQDGATAPAARAAAIALIEEGNALQEQGRVADAMARYEAAKNGEQPDEA